MAAPPEPYRPRADEWAGYPWGEESTPPPPGMYGASRVVYRVEHVHRIEEPPPRVEELTPAARRLIERGGS